MVVVRQTLLANGPFDGDRLLSFLGTHAVKGVETWDGVAYARTLAMSAPATVTLRAVPGGVDVTIESAVSDVETALGLVAHLCGLDDDPTAAQATLVRDPHLAALVARRPGLRRPGSVDAAETLVRTVVGQQVSLAGASAAAARLVERAGQPLGSAHGLTHLFPTPAALARLDPASLPMPRARGSTVVALAAGLAADPQLADDDTALLALPGIGPWTVDYARFRSRRDPDVLLAGDLAVRRQVEALGIAAGPDDVRRLGESWSPHRSTAMMHLWSEYLERPRRSPAGRSSPPPSTCCS